MPRHRRWPLTPSRGTLDSLRRVRPRAKLSGRKKSKRTELLQALTGWAFAFWLRVAIWVASQFVLSFIYFPQIIRYTVKSDLSDIRIY